MPKVWLITGAARGLGCAILEAALQNGDRVLATARGADRFADLQSRYDEHMATFNLDVTDEEQAQAAVAEAVRRFGRLDVLVNNAGYGNIVDEQDQARRDAMRQWKPVSLAADFGSDAPTWPAE